MYNILARISDYYPMKNRFSMEEERVLYDGPWEPYVKDFDPTLNEYNLSCDDAPYFQQVDNHIKKYIQEKTESLQNSEDSVNPSRLNYFLSSH